MKRVAQKSLEHADCGIACVAMASGKTYDDAKAVLAHLEKDGTFYTLHKDLITALGKLGVQAQQKRFRRFRDIETVAIVATNKKMTGEWHWVVYDGTSETPHVLDPKPGKRGKITDFRGLNGFGNYIQINPAKA